MFGHEASCSGLVSAEQMVEVGHSSTTRLKLGLLVGGGIQIGCLMLLLCSAGNHRRYGRRTSSDPCACPGSSGSDCLRWMSEAGRTVLPKPEHRARSICTQCADEGPLQNGQAASCN